MIHVDESDPVGEVEAPFPYKDVTIKRGTDFKEFYELLIEVGRGKFGTVYQCKEKTTGLELAAKVVPVSRREERRNVEREVEIMRRLRHPRLIQLYDAYEFGSRMCVVLELITGGELFERVIDEDFILTEKACTVFMRQICEGIDFVHQQNILHLDLKPENILCLTKAGNRIKIIDFGLARFYDPEKKLQVLFGTPEFVAPEVVNFDQICYGTDMWSVGVICYVLLSGLSPFMGETDIETMANVTVAKYDFDDEAFNEISEEAKDFIRKLLLKDKESRMSASECLRHKWLHRPPPKNIMLPPSPPKNELDVAKDNLRLFVERWSEHPESPYLFDNENHEILYPFRNMSDHSIGGCSPSPRSSLASSPDLVFEEEERPVLLRDHLVKYNPVGRRASDSSCFMHKKADVCLRVNLAEEIKKLSDHLYMLSTMNTELTNNNRDIPNKNRAVTNHDKEIYIDTNSSNKIEVNNNLETRTSLENTKKSNGFKLDGKTSTIYGNSTTIERKVLQSKSTHKLNSTFFKEKEQTPVTSNMPWAKSNRPKRVTNMSRDVPDQPTDKKTAFNGEFDKRRDRIQNLVNGNENGKQLPYRRDDSDNAHRTKDLLLHLLERWGDSEGEPERAVGGTSSVTGRHQSVSMEWSETDRAAHDSISSLHAFFKRQNSDETKKKSLVTVDTVK